MPACILNAPMAANHNTRNRILPAILQERFLDIINRVSGGQEGIRTLETVPRLHTFQACAFDHSATCPWAGLYLSGGACKGLVAIFCAKCWEFYAGVMICPGARKGGGSAGRKGAALGQMQAHPARIAAFVFQLPEAHRANLARIGDMGATAGLQINRRILSADLNQPHRPFAHGRAGIDRFHQLGLCGQILGGDPTRADLQPPCRSDGSALFQSPRDPPAVRQMEIESSLHLADLPPTTG